MNKPVIITIDGPAGAGKSTIAAQLAQRLGVAYLDTGAMYRAITWAALQQNLKLDDTEGVAVLAASARIEMSGELPNNKVWLDGRDITADIREQRVTALSHKIAQNPLVRNILVDQQRNIAAHVGSIVTEGRDQGTEVFPEATHKFYLDADTERRAQRRFNELKEKGLVFDFEEIRDAIVKRDRRDSDREVAPLRKAEDAVSIDSTELSIDEVLDRMCALIEENCKP